MTVMGTVYIDPDTVAGVTEQKRKVLSFERNRFCLFRYRKTNKKRFSLRSAFSRDRRGLNSQPPA